MAYGIVREPWGFRLTFGGFIRAEEARRWLADARVQLGRAVEPFSVVVDMRELHPLPADAQAIIREGQEAFLAAGMTRSAVVVANAVTLLQFTRTAAASGIASVERYFDGSKDGWEVAAMAWALDGIDPERAR